MAGLVHKTGGEIKTAFSQFQRSKMPPLRILDEESAVAQEARAVYKIETIEPDTRYGARRWGELHNDSDVRIIAEKDYMRHRDGLKTVIRYVMYIKEVDLDALADELMPD